MNLTLTLAQLVATVASIVFATVTPILIVIYTNRNQAKREQDDRHVENQKKLDALMNEQDNYPQHFHQEWYTSKNGDDALNIGGIIMRPKPWEKK